VCPLWTPLRVLGGKILRFGCRENLVPTSPLLVKGEPTEGVGAKRQLGSDGQAVIDAACWFAAPSGGRSLTRFGAAGFGPAWVARSSSLPPGGGGSSSLAHVAQAIPFLAEALIAGGNRAKPKVASVRLPTEKAKEKFLLLLGEGSEIDPALAAVGMSSRSTYERWRREDAEFRKNADFVQARRNSGVKKPLPDFETFCSEYLGEQLFWHQLQWIDVLEGREPRGLHSAQVYRPGRPTRVLINTPPNHAKSTTITQNYVTWRILKNPGISIVIVSKTETFAKDFIHGIKQRLSGLDYRQLQIDFGPPEGFEKTAAEWSATRIRLESDSGQKDPTVQVVGMGGQIYGKRAHLIILDDCVVLSNAHEYEKQALWVRQEVATRLHKGGRLLIVGTRVSHMDLYKFMRDDDGKNVYTYLSQPVVLEFADDPADWVTLWPRSNVPPSTDDEDEPVPDEDGLFPRWDGPAVFDLREEAAASSWALAYMQTDVSVDSTFPEKSVLASINGQRAHGVLRPGNLGHPERGMDGMYRLCTMDPALAGSCAAIAMAVDRKSGKRYVLDVFNKAGMTPAGIHEHIRVWTEKYSPHEWRIEKNAMQGMLTQDEVLRQYLNTRGVQLKEHFTGSNKWDEEFGVASMAPLFPRLDGEGAVIRGSGLIELPSPKWNEAVNQLVAQLLSWAPKMQGQKAKPGTTDIVMALWFAEIRARELIMSVSSLTHLPNRYLSRGARAQRMSVDVEAAIIDQQTPEDALL
jgi:hypothetical protein